MISQKKGGPMEKEFKKNKLTRLTISPQGFVFDPYTGQGYTANTTARFMISLLNRNRSKEAIIKSVQQQFRVSFDEAEIDTEDMFHQLQIIGLI
jgi:coenzyme PQQ synthesis protein D (PqqD)